MNDHVGHVEEAGRKHSGVFGIVQTVIGGLLLLVAAGILASQRDTNATALEQTKQIARIEGGLAAVTAQIASMQIQLGGISQMSERITRVEAEIQEDRRRINDIEQARKLK